MNLQFVLYLHKAPNFEMEKYNAVKYLLNLKNLTV